MSNNLIKFTKAWNFPDKTYGEKEIYINPDVDIKWIEATKVKSANGKEIDCTKITYPTGTFTKNDVVVVIGTVDEFFDRCKDSKIFSLLLSDLEKEGLTIKQFLQQNERLNRVEI